MSHLDRMNTNKDEERVENLLRFAADWEPGSAPPTAEMIQRALSASGRRKGSFQRAIVFSGGQTAWVFVPAVCAVLGVAVVTHLQPHRTVNALRHTDSPPAISTRIVKAIAAPPNVEPSSVAYEVAVRSKEIVHSPRRDRQHGVMAKALIQIARTEKTRPAVPGIAAKPLQIIGIEPHSSPAAESADSLPADAVSLDDDTHLVIVPVVYADNDPETSGNIRLLPAVVAIPVAADATSAAATAATETVEIKETPI